MSDAPPDSDADHDHDHAPETNQAIGLGLAHGVGLGILLSPRAESDSIADSQQAPEPTRRFKKEKEKPVLRFAGTSSANPGSAQPARASARQPSHAVAIRPIAAPDFAPISAFDLLHQPDDPEQEPSIAAEEEEEEPKRAPRGRKRTRFANESQNEYFDHDERLRSQSVLGSQDGRMVKGLVGGVGGLGDAPREEDDQDGFDEGYVLCILHVKKRLGAAAYSETTGVLSVLPECQETETFDVAEQVISQLRPRRILTSTRCDDPFLAFLAPAPSLHIRPSTEFGFPSCLARLLSLSIRERDGASEPPDRDEARRWLSGRIDLAPGNLSVIAAGALLGQLQRMKVGEGPEYRKKRGRKQIVEDEEEQEREAEVVVRRIEEMGIKRGLVVSEETLRALSVFLDDAHPSMHSRHRKEGLSLYSLLDSTLTPLGKRLLRSWLLKPSADPGVIQRRHDAISLFTRGENETAIMQLRAGLKMIGNIRKLVRNMQSQPAVADFQAILRFAYYSIKIRTHVREVVGGGRVEIIRKIEQSYDAPTLRELGTVINSIVDFDASTAEERFVVKSGIDAELDEMKRTYEGLEGLLSEVAMEVAESVDVPEKEKLNCIYFPQLGFLVTVPLQPDWKTATDFELPGLQYQFCTAQTVYYKNDKMRELDTVIGDIHGLIADREIEIMHSLSEQLLEHADFMIKIGELAAELDCLVSFALAAKKYNYVRPAMTEANVLLIKKGRHPLAELVSDTFVTNDIRFDEIREDVDDDVDPTRIVLLSGANCSGKSTYLKEAALIVLMAHVGSFVPAESAVIGYTDRILSRITTRETVSKAESAFMHDLIQVNMALTNATARSLVLLDEFGKGTQTTDGIALLCAALEHFANRGSGCPKVLVATHFHEMFTNELLPPSRLINYNVMEVMQGDDPRELTFLYRVVEGRATRSFGNFVASLAGLPLEVVERAEEVSHKFARFEPVEIRNEEDEEAKHELAGSVAGAFLDLDLDAGFDQLEEFLDQVCRRAEAMGI